MPNLPELHGLRHCWCWEKRKRPYLPTWSFAKVPRLQFSPEENARLLSVYMRAWTLRESESTQYNPLLSLLGKCEKQLEELVPLWLALPQDATGSAQDAVNPRPLKRRMQRKDTDPYKYRDKIKKREDSEANKKKGHMRELHLQYESRISRGRWAPKTMESALRLPWNRQ